MHIHEYQAKKLLNKFGIKIPKGKVAFSEEDVQNCLSSLRLKEAILKAQIHAGARKKVRAILVGNNPQEIKDHFNQLVGSKFINEQTGPLGLTAHCALIEEKVNIQKEYYLSLSVDRKNASLLLVCSKEGGSDIESTSKNVQNILKTHVDLKGNIKIFDWIYLLKFMGWTHDLKKKAIDLISKLIELFVSSDALLIEINPLVLTQDNEFVALDAKMTIDDNALYRQSEIAAFYDPTQLDALEVKARKSGLSYIPFKGNIGCLVNGAGLAMATLDELSYFGGNPANFLDLGGGADKNRISEGFKILLDDYKVKSILVHIFGGIMDCEVVADAIIDVLKQIKPSKINRPIVVRLEGANRQKGYYKLVESGFQIIVKDNLVGAVKEAIIQAGIL
jgi:succinyl-CoA synthetase beta subunit